MITRRVDAGPAGGFDVHRLDSRQPGPRLVVLGGVHGDETEGALAAGRLAAEPPELIRGVLEVVPVCHEAAFETDSRISPVDGVNLARMFPGDPVGTPTARLAHAIFTEVLDGADFLIDLHTSGQHYDMPFLAGYRGATSNTGSVGERAAVAFGADFVWRHPGRSQGRTVSVVDHAIYCECPGSGPTDAAFVEAYVTGVLRVLGVLGLVTSPPPPRAEPQIHVTGGGDLDRDMVSVGNDGVFFSQVSRGQAVERGDVLGRLVDLQGTELESPTAPRAGRVMAIKQRSPVRRGDLIVCIAEADTAP